jgi:hypothetical protein
MVDSSCQSQRLIRSVLENVRGSFPHDLHSLILTGSLARDEGTWLINNSRWTLAGDAEFLLVFEERTKLPEPERIAALQVRIQGELAANDIDAKIGLSPVHPAYLRSLRPHIFAYELVTNGRILCGEETILDLVPRFSASEIPLEDGFRILMNRLIELTEAVCESGKCEANLSKMHYRALKLTLDMVTSYLVFVGDYCPTYQARLERLCQRAKASSELLLSDRFLDRALAATRIKMSASCEPAFDDDPLAILDDARMLWRWELERLTARNTEAADRTLMLAWVASQGIPERLRGWVSLIKRSGVLNHLGQLPRCLTKIVAGSPRRLTYAVTSELCFALPGLISEADSEQSNDLRWNQLRCQLPMPDKDASSEHLLPWQRLGLAISRNYHRFLEDTRS